MDLLGYWRSLFNYSSVLTFLNSIRLVMLRWLLQYIDLRSVEGFNWVLLGRLLMRRCLGFGFERLALLSELNFIVNYMTEVSLMRQLHIACHLFLTQVSQF